MHGECRGKGYRRCLGCDSSVSLFNVPFLRVCAQPSQGGNNMMVIGGVIAVGSAAAYYAYSTNNSSKNGKVERS